MAQVVKILHVEHKDSLYPPNQNQMLLVTWWCKEPGHKQQWYWPSCPRIFWFEHLKEQPQLLLTHTYFRLSSIQNILEHSDHVNDHNNSDEDDYLP